MNSTFSLLKVNGRKYCACVNLSSPVFTVICTHDLLRFYYSWSEGRPSLTSSFLLLVNLRIIFPLYFLKLSWLSVLWRDGWRWPGPGQAWLHTVPGVRRMALVRSVSGMSMMSRHPRHSWIIAESKHDSTILVTTTIITVSRTLKTVRCYFYPSKYSGTWHHRSRGVGDCAGAAAGADPDALAEGPQPPWSSPRTSSSVGSRRRSLR